MRADELAAAAVGRYRLKIPPSGERIDDEETPAVLAVSVRVRRGWRKRDSVPDHEQDTSAVGREIETDTSIQARVAGRLDRIRGNLGHHALGLVEKPFQSPLRENRSGVQPG